MLLVGSRAAKIHFPSFREPVDWDVFATRDELARVRALGLPEIPSSWSKKARFAYEGTILEVGVADPGTTNHALLRETRGTCAMPQIGEVSVASPEALLFLKRSHLPFLIQWSKSIDDVRFLRRRVTLGPRLLALLPQRLEETRGQLLPSQRSFPKEPGRYCAPPADAGQMHALLHEVVKLGRRPARDCGRPFLSLPRPSQLRVLAEEAMAIALERYFLPALPGMPLPGERSALACAYQELVVSTLSFELREIAVDAIDEALALVPKGFTRDFTRRLDALLDQPSVVRERPITLALLPHHSA